MATEYRDDTLIVVFDKTIEYLQMKCNNCFAEISSHTNLGSHLNKLSKKSKNNSWKHVSLYQTKMRTGKRNVRRN